MIKIEVEYHGTTVKAEMDTQDIAFLLQSESSKAIIQAVVQAFTSFGVGLMEKKQ